MISFQKLFNYCICLLHRLFNSNNNIGHSNSNSINNRLQLSHRLNSIDTKQTNRCSRNRKSNIVPKIISIDNRAPAVWRCAKTYRSLNVRLLFTHLNRLPIVLEVLFDWIKHTNLYAYMFVYILEHKSNAKISYNCFNSIVVNFWSSTELTTNGIEKVWISLKMIFNKTHWQCDKFYFLYYVSEWLWYFVHTSFVYIFCDRYTNSNWLNNKIDLTINVLNPFKQWTPPSPPPFPTSFTFSLFHFHWHDIFIVLRIIAGWY